MSPAREFKFDLLLPRRVVFGWGRRREIGDLARTLGSRALVIDGSRTLRASAMWSEMASSLSSAGLKFQHVASASREPTIEDVDGAARALRALNAGPGDVVVAIGGGSAIDLAKAAAAMATNGSESVRCFLEGVGTGRTIEVDPLPVLAVPATAGTGSEATKNAVISVDDPPCKKSLRSEKMIPSVVLVDPELSVSCSSSQTASCGMDAITQLIEAAISRRSSPLVLQMCAATLRGALEALPEAYRNPDDRAARETMSLAAFTSGVALANGGLGMAHGVAAALGAECQVPHGLACAVMLPVALRTNRTAAADSLEELATRAFTERKCVTGSAAVSESSATERLVRTVDELFPTLGLPRRLRDLGVKREQIPALVSGSRGNSMSGNPRELSDDELRQILEESW